MSRHFDLVVLGSGPGGYVAALKAALLGAKTAIVEKDHLGGTCLNNGCIPSKALLASAELMHHIRLAADMGIEVAGEISVNWSRIQARKDKILHTLRGGIKALLGARKVTIVPGRGVISGPGKMTVNRDGQPGEQITADRTILAVGSVPARIPGWPADPAVVCTSDEALHWKTLPKRLLIVGGGVIGCEFACMMEALGVEVTIVEMLPRLLPNLDAQIAETLTGIFTKRGIKVFTGTRIQDLAADGRTATGALSNGMVIKVDRVLVATGRKPNTADIGLDSAGLTTDRGFIRVNDRMESPARGYYCIGDANGRCLLAHAASAQAMVAVENALGHERAFHAPVPNAVYTFPEIASVGMTADDAKAHGLPVATGFFPLTHLGKALAVADNDGFVKVIRHRETDELLGVHMIGHNVTECIAAAGAMMHQRVTVRDVAETVFAHPTITEALKEAAEDAMQAALHLPPRKTLKLVAQV